ncbi:MAG: hypothetical protein IJH65_13805 [Methanobrevibacter sp.]|nr:hypothetical protein [Methanobrevibacter sp.]
MKYFRFTINPKGNEFMVSVRIDEFLNGVWRLVDYYVCDSQSISSRLIWEREKAVEGLFDLEIIDNRPYFTMV